MVVKVWLCPADDDGCPADDGLGDREDRGLKLSGSITSVLFLLPHMRKRQDRRSKLRVWAAMLMCAGEGGVP